MRKVEYVWFGDVPLEWTAKKIKYVTKLRNEKKSKLTDEIYLGLENIEPRTGKYFVDSNVEQNVEGISNCFYKGDVLFGKLRPYLAKCIESDFDGVCTTELLVMRCVGEKIKPTYLKYLLLSPKFIDLINSSTYGTKMPRANWEFIKNIEIPFPDLETQRKIAKYIQSKEQGINALIKSKENIIKLLEEKRQSIITEAVTKGLNPNAKMKDSGMEWIGEIPEHWEKSKLGYLGRLQNGISKAGDEFGYGSPFVSYSDVYKNIILPSQVNGLVNTTEEEQKLYSVEKGDIFFTRTSETIEEIGFSSVCFETIPKATFAGFLIKFRPNLKRVSPNFAKYYFRSNLRKHYFIKEMNLVTRASLGQGLLRNFPMLLPSLVEQEAIACYLDNEVSNTNSAISLIDAQIQKLKEYRQSLIYEAVTGKIDVRELVAGK